MLMVERSALYYPHIELQSAALLRTNLLLWDEVHFIVPEESEDFKPEYYERPQFARAYELIGRPHYPSEKEKEDAHELILDFATRQLPDALLYKDSETRAEDYQIFPDKFLEPTWQVLQEAQLAGKKMRDHYPLREMCSLSIMSILADCCAGKSLRRITDRGRAYGSLVGLLTDKTSPAGAKPDETHERLVPISLKVIDVSDLDIDRLLDLREREEKLNSGGQIRQLRHRYIDALSGVAKKLAEEATSSADHREIERQFEEDMKDDLTALKEELKLSNKETLLSKEVLTIGVVGAAAASYFTGHHVVELGKELNQLLTWTGASVTFGGAYLAGSKFQAKRQEILKKHPMAYLYEYN
jgi:hypothetical protein